jgi:hypothetical protein
VRLRVVTGRAPVPAALREYDEPYPRPVHTRFPNNTRQTNQGRGPWTRYGCGGGKRAPLPLVGIKAFGEL